MKYIQSLSFNLFRSYRFLSWSTVGVIYSRSGLFSLLSEYDSQILRVGNKTTLDIVKGQLVPIFVIYTTTDLLLVQFLNREENKLALVLTTTDVKSSLSNRPMASSRDLYMAAETRCVIRRLRSMDLPSSWRERPRNIKVKTKRSLEG